MIEEINIKNLGVIEDARLSLSAGFTAITGETGAGKTMLTSALDLVQGARADTRSIRTQADSAETETIFGISSSQMRERIEMLGIEVELQGDTGELNLARSISSDGKSKAFVNARKTTAKTLKDLSGHLMTMHGQNEQIRLKEESAQRAALDAYAGSEEFDNVTHKYKKLYQEYADLLSQLERSHDESEQIRHEKAYLQTALETLDRLDLTPGEDKELDEKIQRLTYAEDLKNAAFFAQQMFSGEEQHQENIISQIDQGLKSLEKVSDYDNALAQVAQAMSELAVSAAEISSDLSSYLAGAEEENSQELAQAQMRKADIMSALKQYGSGSVTTSDALIEWVQKSHKRLAQLEQQDHDPATVQKNADQKFAELVDTGQKLRTLRQEAAQKLSSALSEELSLLAMNSTEFTIYVEPLDQPARHGLDKISFRIKSHAGAPDLPIEKGASGGELSRIMLALEVILADTDGVETFVFDEVDAGVGGAAAIEVGRRLAQLGKTHQVLVVTHLPQVAAFAQNHLRIRKQEADSGADTTVTSSDISMLDKNQRVKEIARMLAGVQDSQSAQEHAQELLDQGKKEDEAID